MKCMQHLFPHISVCRLLIQNTATHSVKYSCINVCVSSYYPTLLRLHKLWPNNVPRIAINIYKNQFFELTPKPLHVKFVDLTLLQWQCYYEFQNYTIFCTFHFVVYFNNCQVGVVYAFEISLFFLSKWVIQ